MRQLPAEKYNVAWFKLAEFVVRGEKERALNLYRLLAHAFESKALTYQLEGDLLSSFGDEQAIEKYAEAAHYYMKENRFVESKLLYEYILSIKSNRIMRMQLLDVYAHLADHDQLIKNLEIVRDELLRDQLFVEAEEVIEKYNQQFTDVSRLLWYEQTTLKLVLYNVPDNLVIKYAKKTIDLLMVIPNNTLLQQFLAKLELLEKPLYEQLRQYMRQLLPS